MADEDEKAVKSLWLPTIDGEQKNFQICGCASGRMAWFTVLGKASNKLATLIYQQPRMKYWQTLTPEGLRRSGKAQRHRYVQSDYGVYLRIFNGADSCGDYQGLANWLGIQGGGGITQKIHPQRFDLEG
eukprot:3797935-Ditylum_brightwellii.AAC.1